MASEYSTRGDRQHSKRVFVVGEVVAVWYVDSPLWWSAEVTAVLGAMYRVTDSKGVAGIIVSADRVFDPSVIGSLSDEMANA